MVYPKIGSKLRIISKANVRYEGIFLQIDTENLQIALSDVHFFGTESRAAEVFIASQNRIYPYVLFKSTDIKDIYVLSGPEELQAPQVTIPTHALNFLRTSPCANSGENSSAEPAMDTCRARRNIMVNHCMARRSPYPWRMPPVVDYVGRSGDPNELPAVYHGENCKFDQEYDFEKYNKLFEDLCCGMKELNLSFECNNAPQSSSASAASSSSSSPSLPTSSLPLPTKVAKAAEFNSNEYGAQSYKNVCTDNSNKMGAKPKTVGVDAYTQKSSPVTSTAYDKSKSFYDKVSCSSIYRSPNTNPNWREWNRETFGVPMIRHQRRSRRSSYNFNNGSDNSNIEQLKRSKQATSSYVGTSNQNREKVTVKKIQIKAVIYTKSRGPRGEKNAEVLAGNDNVKSNGQHNANEKKNIKGYSLDDYDK